jgi:hypothetical protein
MAMSNGSLKYILGIFVIFFQLIYTDYINWAYFDKKITFKFSLQCIILESSQKRANII